MEGSGLNNNNYTQQIQISQEFRSESRRLVGSSQLPTEATSAHFEHPVTGAELGAEGIGTG
jgi:hypothetical protein